MGMSLEHLAKDAKDLYFDFAIFDEDVKVPAKVSNFVTYFTHNLLDRVKIIFRILIDRKIKKSIYFLSGKEGVKI